jgi:hypothetical protein
MAKKNDYSKCPKCGQQLYIIVGSSDEGYYHCYVADSDLGQGEEIEIAEGSRLDRADEIENCTDYTCNLSLAQGVLEDFESTACGEIYCKSEEELKWMIDYYCIVTRKAEAYDKMLETGIDEKSIPGEWVKKHILSDVLNDKSFAKWALKEDGLLLEYFSDTIKSDLNLVKTAIESSSNAASYIDSSLLNNKKKVISLVESSRDVLESITVNKDWLNDIDFVQQVVESMRWGFQSVIGDELWKNASFIKECLLKDGNTLVSPNFPKELLNDRKLLAEALNTASDEDALLLYLPREVMVDLDFWKEVKRQAGTLDRFFKYLPADLKESKIEFEQAIEFSDASILFAPNKFKDSKSVLNILKQKIETEDSIGDTFIIYAKSLNDETINKQLEMATKKDLCTLDVWDNSGELNSLAWTIYEARNFFENTHEELNRAASFCLRSLEIEESHLTLDTYAHLLHELGDDVNALKNAKKAVELATELREDTTSYLQFIESIKV